MSDEELIRRGEVRELLQQCGLMGNHQNDPLTVMFNEIPAERDALKAEQIDAIRAAMEETVAICTDLAVGYAGHECAPTALIDAVSHIRAIDPATIAAKLKGDGNER